MKKSVHFSSRNKLRPKRTKVPGQAPGTLVVDENAPKPELAIIAYRNAGGDGDYYEAPLTDLSTLPDFLKKWPVVWVNVYGLGDLATILKLGEIFSLHNLSLEDVLNVTQRPKVDEHEKYIYIVTRLTTMVNELSSEQISLFLGSNFVLTFQEKKGDCFDGVRDRLRKGKGKIRNDGADYLAYALIDSIVDHAYPLLEHYGERLEELELKVLDNPDQLTLREIHTIKRELLQVRRAVWPMRELLNTLMRESMPFIEKDIVIYLRDCYDHTIQVIDLLENYREIATGLVDIYLSMVSNKMNDVMKVLTIIATIFIPLSFIAGLYGMNFSHEASPWNMPELYWRYGYPFALSVMVVMSGSMLFYFRRKGWLGGSTNSKK